MDKLFIKNRDGKKIAVLLELHPQQKGLVFILHGQGGFKDSPQTEAMAKGFLEGGFTVVRFDARNTIGESEGSIEDASITSYYQDLEDVIQWATSQPWHQQPFALSGQSLGGICVGLYAEKHPERINALALFSTVISGKLNWENHDPKELEEWKRTGFKVRESVTKPGTTIRLKWFTMEDRLQYDLLEDVDKLTMPVLLVVGDEDTTTPLAHIQMLYDRLSGNKELRIVQGAKHVFREEKHLKEAAAIIGGWIKHI